MTIYPIFKVLMLAYGCFLAYKAMTDKPDCQQDYKDKYL